MKVIKEGKVRRLKDGTYRMYGFHIDAEGEPMDFEKFMKITLQRLDKE